MPLSVIDPAIKIPHNALLPLFGWPLITVNASGVDIISPFIFSIGIG